MLSVGRFGLQDSNGDIIFLSKKSDEAVHMYKMSVATDATFIAGKRFVLGSNLKINFGPKAVTTDSSNNIYVLLSSKKGTFCFIKLPSDMSTVEIKYIDKTKLYNGKYSGAVLWDT